MPELPNYSSLWAAVSASQASQAGSTIGPAGTMTTTSMIPAPNPYSIPPAPLWQNTPHVAPPHDEPYPDDIFDDDQEIPEEYVGDEPESPGLLVKKKQTEKGNKIYNLPLVEAFPKLKSKEQAGEIGLEIECEGTNLFQAPIQYWTTHIDNSLRPTGEHPPVEYVLMKPISRENVPKALSYLGKKLKETGSKIVDSTRTSVHVHINCQRLTLKQVYQFVCLYTVFEEILTDFCGPTRVGNLFTLGAKHAQYSIEVMEQAIQTEQFNELFSQDLRYSACNMASLGKFGSLEFRALRGTVDEKLIQLWVDVLLTLRDTSLKYSDPKGIVDDFLKLGPFDFCRKIFSRNEDQYSIFYGRSDLYQSLWDGLRLMRDVAHAVEWEPYDKSLAEIDKKNNAPKVKRMPYCAQYPASIVYWIYAEGYPTGWFWLVNSSSQQLQVPRGGGLLGNWTLSGRHKLLITANRVVDLDTEVEADE